jgi:hypothetical protein
VPAKPTYLSALVSASWTNDADQIHPDDVGPLHSAVVNTNTYLDELRSTNAQIEFLLSGDTGGAGGSTRRPEPRSPELLPRRDRRP